MRRVAVIGYGAIGRSILQALSATSSADVQVVGVLARPSQIDEAASTLGREVLVTDDIGRLLALRPDVVVEAAGHACVVDHGQAILEQGAEFHVLSVGALADDALRARLEGICARSGGAVVIPAGALAAFDGLLSMRAGGLDAVTYISTKPPLAWRGTEAETLVDLDALTQPVVLLEASAREAALRFPRNANLAAAVALAGLGLDRTRVKLVADPGVRSNTGRVIAEGDLGRLELTLSGGGFGANPKTSQITGYSVVAGLRNAAATIRFN